jgi:RNA polymerase-associated protein
VVNGTPKAAEKARMIVRDNLTQIAPIFNKQKYMLGDEYSMLDVAIAPLLWRLGPLRHPAAQAGHAAAEICRALFSRPAFIEALTPIEKAMRK